MALYSDNSWPRLEKVIVWSKMNPNRFAKHIGLSRAETLYQIERGKHNLSRKVAEAIIAKFPEVSISWLLTGVGEMFIDSEDVAEKIDFFNVDAESNIRNVTSLTPESKLLLTNDLDGDFAMVYRGEAMGNSIPTNTIVILKRVLTEQIIFGKEYLIQSPRFTALRAVRQATGVGGGLRLVAASRGEYDDLTLQGEEIEAAYRVVAKLIINY